MRECLQDPGNGVHIRRMRNFLLSILVAAAPVGAAPSPVWIGTFGKGEAAGIYRAGFDQATGVLAAPVKVAALADAGFLAMSGDGKHAFSTGSGPGPDGKPGGLVAAWARGRGEEPWKLLGTRPSGGGICHVSVAPDGQTIMAANYTGGSVVSFRFDEGKGLGERVSFVQHTGKGPNQARQEAAHAHAIVPLPGGDFAAAADLGIDAVVVYAWDRQTSALKEHSRVATPPGAGPRHLAVHPDGKVVYVVNELDITVSVFGWDAGSGKLTPRQVVDARPPGMPVDDLSSAEIRIRGDGHFLYTSTRDLSDQRRDFLTVFKVGQDGLLSPVQHAPAGVSIPRNFALSPDGRWLLAGGQKSSSIQVHAVDPATGKLTMSGKAVDCPAPVCFVFGAAED